MNGMLRDGDGEGGFDFVISRISIMQKVLS